jgi:hypothetical protein
MLTVATYKKQKLRKIQNLFFGYQSATLLLMVLFLLFKIKNIANSNNSTEIEHQNKQ